MLKKHFNSLYFIIIGLSILTFTLFSCSNNPAIDETADIAIEGRIIDTDGNPAPEMTLLIVKGTGDFPDTPVTSDSNGNFRIGKVSDGTYEIVAFDKKGNKLGSKIARVRRGKCGKVDFVVPKDDSNFIIGEMHVDDVSINLLESYPYQVHIVVNGILNDGCTTINEITQKRDGNTINVNITTKRPKDAFCIQVVKMVEERIPLDGGFLPGHYKIIVNGFVKEFDIGSVVIDEGMGLLQGKVTIGPLCPVEPCNIPPILLAEVYITRKIVIYDQVTKLRVKETKLDKEGFYALSLKPGKYIVDVTDSDGNILPLQEPRNFGNAIPEEAEIMIGKVTILNFDIDTGIR